jgi:hypothetical protein
MSLAECKSVCLFLRKCSRELSESGEQQVCAAIVRRHTRSSRTSAKLKKTALGSQDNFVTQARPKSAAHFGLQKQDRFELLSIESIDRNRAG